MLPAGADSPFVRIAALIEARFGLHPRLQTDRLAGFLASRSPRQQQDLADHLSLTAEHDPVWQLLVEAMLVHETFFFRHPDQLAVMTSEVVPKLRGSLGFNDTLKVWCAGCSTGEEAYSLACLLRDAACRAEILATDLSAQSVAEARSALYRRRPGLNSFRSMPAQAWRHFEAQSDEADCWQVAASVRQMVRFTVHNLLTPLPNSFQADLISCRNVLIYFSEDALRQVEAALVAASRPGTVLLLGPAERLRFSPMFVPLTERHPQILHWPRPEGPR